MAVLYPATAVSGYNANPPPDDGTTVPNNLEKWSDVKTKIGDPLNVFAGAVDSNVTAAFGKTLDGATVVSSAVDYPMTGADQGRLIVITVAGKTVTTPDATVVTAPFTFAINNQSAGTITIDGSGTQTVDGQLTQTLKAGAGCIVKTDGTNWFTYGLKPAQLVSVNPPYGFDAPINLGLAASVGSNILTIAIKTNSGADPTPGDPVLIPFRDVTIANGGPVWVAITAALSMTTNAVGATLGTQNSVPFRLWIVCFNNGGTPVLALWHSGAGAATTAINPLAETNLQSATGISAAATSAGVFYCPNGTTLTSVAFRTLGFAAYDSGLATAGTYASVPTKLQLFGPGVRKPGDIVQTASANLATSVAITPTSPSNLIKVVSTTQLNGSSSTMNVTLKRGSTTLIVIGAQPGSTIASMPFAVSWLDNPGTTSATTYSLSGTNGTPQATNTNILLDEIMG